jgi:phosphoribosylaminoimidazolecarboxamide formyltransferase/IMP cyclohydrolase
MSFNNYTDADAAWRAACDHADPCVAIIKHANPCGIAINENIAIAYTKALECDSVSAYGAVVAANRIVTTQLALALSETFTEVLIAPGFESEALEVLTQKPSIRILECVATKRQRIELRPISGGALLQEVDAIDSTGDSSATWKLVAGSQANSETMKDLEFAWRAVRSVKSNAILLAKDGATIGVGMGQVNRVDSAELAVKRAGVRATGSVASSDAFFPFADGLKVLISAGITAVVSPGGSVRDEEIIAAAEEAGISLYFTGTRHFSHS